MLLEFCFSTTNFKYNGKHFKQIFGTATGSPVSAVMANLIIEDLEEKALSSIVLKPLCWKRYVDDMSSAIGSSEVVPLQQHLNSVEPSI